MRKLWVVSLVLAIAAPLIARQPSATQNLAIKYARDSQEYATLARQVYRHAAASILASVNQFRREEWVVSADIDETALDNSTYQLERAVAYGLPHDATSFNAWVERRAAPAVPGAIEFARAIHKAGGRIAWISNRSATTTKATQANLEALDMFSASDLLCLETVRERTKKIRRKEVLSGNGDCSWPGKPMKFAGFVGDQMGDFPDADEGVPGTGVDTSFGSISFLLPNAMYGAWTTSVTRKP